MKIVKKINANQFYMRGLKGSLAFRILLIETILLVIPLLIFAGVMYYEDSRVKAEDSIFTLTLVLSGKRELIQEMLDGERNFLRYVDELQPKQSEFAKLISEKDSSILFHLVKRQEGYVCDKASQPGLIGMDFSNIIPKTITSFGIFVGDESTDQFYFFQPVLHGEELWAISFSQKRLTDKLAIKNDVSYPVIVSLLSDKGAILASTSMAWKKWEAPSLLKKKRHFSFMGKKYLGEFGKIKRSNLLLLVVVPNHMSLVNIPYFFAKIIIFLAIILLVGGGGTLWLTFRLGKPLKRLCMAMERVQLADLKARYKPDKMGFEINVVGEIFNAMTQSLLTFIDRIKHERAAKEVFERELMIGQEVQTSILPKELPSFPGLDIAARFVSAKEVGGDFYDFLTRPSGQESRLFFSIADTAGKGIYACLYSLTVRSMLRSYGEIYDDLDVIVRETNNLFCLDTGDTGVFVTAWIGFFDEISKKLHFSNCGHFPGYLMRKNSSVEKLTTKGMALGVEPFEQVHTDSVQLSSGDRLLLFTDGIVEAHNEKLEMFGEKQLLDSFAMKKDLESKEIVDKIIEEVALFTQAPVQHDDLTLLVLKVD